SASAAATCTTHTDALMALEPRSFSSTGNCMPRRRARGSHPAEHQGAVGSAEAEVVLQGYVDLHLAGNVGAIVQVALGVLLEEVDRRRRDLVVHREGGDDRLEPAGAAEQVAGHRLGGVHHQLL